MVRRGARPWSSTEGVQWAAPPPANVILQAIGGGGAMGRPTSFERRVIVIQCSHDGIQTYRAPFPP